jgi:hypothetical protein
MNLKPALLLYGIILASASFNLLAQAPIKSVDQAGNVTYSDKPVVGAKSTSNVAIEPGPSGTEIEAAEKRAGEMIKQADQVQIKHEVRVKKNESALQEIEAGGQLSNSNNHSVRPIRPIVRPPVTIPERPTRPPLNRPSPRGAAGR